MNRFLSSLLGTLVTAALLWSSLPAYAQDDKARTASAEEDPYLQTCDLADRSRCHRFTKAKKYYFELNPDATEEEWLDMERLLRPFTNPAKMAEIMAHPARMASWMAGLSSPDAVHLMMRCSQEPIMWNTWMRTFTDPGIMMQAMLPFMNPGTYFKWAFAPMDPNVYAGFAPLADPELYTAWGDRLAQPKYYEPLYSWLNPQWSIDRMTWAMNPATYGNLFAWWTQAFAYPTQAPATGYPIVPSPSSSGS